MFDNINANTNHKWEKNHMSSTRSNSIKCEHYICSVCGIKGRKFSFDERIIRYSKYSAGEYRYCKGNGGRGTQTFIEAV